jgi:cytochrome b pre-mRNA-processing protein 3
MPDTIASLYGTFVAQARAPVFYQSYGVPDTVNGRLEMIMLHTVLLLHRLDGAPEDMRALGQAVFDHFCRDIDANLREMGVGDLTVPKTMRRIGEAFYGRQSAYASALGAADEELAAALRRNVFDGAPKEAAGVTRLTAYVRQAVEQLAAQEEKGGLSRGEVRFPAPERVEVLRAVAADGRG